MSYQSLQTLSQLAIALGLILAALGGYGAYYYGRKVEDGKAAYEKILVTPSEIILPAHASRKVPIIVTNNLPYPVFMVAVQIEVIEGDVDLTKDFMPFGSGIWQPKFVSCQIEQINNGAAAMYTWNIDGSTYDNPSRIKVSVSSYLKEPAPDLIMHGMDTLPDKLEFPEGYFPPPQDNRSKK